MDEASVSAYTRKKLEKRGFHVTKFNDASTSGILDTFIAKDGKGLWIEDKYIEIDVGFVGSENGQDLLPFRLKAKDFVEPKRLNQLVNAVKMEKVFPTQYWLYILNGDKLYIAVLSPRDVWNSYRHESMSRGTENEETDKVLINPVKASVWRSTFTL